MLFKAFNTSFEEVFNTYLFLQIIQNYYWKKVENLKNNHCLSETILQSILVVLLILRLENRIQVYGKKLYIYNLYKANKVRNRKL